MAKRKAAPEKKQGRISRHIEVARELHEQPRNIVPLARGWLLRLWILKGGGFYGLGYVATFVVLEIKALTDDIGGSESLAGFITSQLFQYVVRVSVQSLLNVILSVVWPVFLVQWFNVWGLVVLVGGYVAFERVARPLVESWFPEIGHAREAKLQAKQEKLRAKEARKARRAGRGAGE